MFLYDPYMRIVFTTIMNFIHSSPQEVIIMSEVKTPILDICDFNKRMIHSGNGKRPSETLEIGSEVSVQQNGYEISLTVLTIKEDGFIGKIIEFSASPNEYQYEGLKIKDFIKFKIENICSIP